MAHSLCRAAEPVGQDSERYLGAVTQTCFRSKQRHIYHAVTGYFLQPAYAELKYVSVEHLSECSQYHYHKGQKKYKVFNFLKLGQYFFHVVSPFHRHGRINPTVSSKV